MMAVAGWMSSEPLSEEARPFVTEMAAHERRVVLRCRPSSTLRPASASAPPERPGRSDHALGAVDVSMGCPGSAVRSDEASGARVSAGDCALLPSQSGSREPRQSAAGPNRPVNLTAVDRFSVGERPRAQIISKGSRPTGEDPRPWPDTLVIYVLTRF